MPAPASPSALSAGADSGSIADRWAGASLTGVGRTSPGRRVRSRADGIFARLVSSLHPHFEQSAHHGRGRTEARSNDGLVIVQEQSNRKPNSVHAICTGAGGDGTGSDWPRQAARMSRVAVDIRAPCGPAPCGPPCRPPRQRALPRRRADGPSSSPSWHRKASRRLSRRGAFNEHVYTESHRERALLARSGGSPTSASTCFARPRRARRRE